MKYIILTGHRKSGTSLLHRLFDNHPELNVYPVDISLLYAYYPIWTNKNFSLKYLKKRFILVIKKSLAKVNNKKILKNGKKFNINTFINIIFKNYNLINLTEPGLIIKAISNSYCDYLGLDKSLPFVIKETSQTINFRKILEIIPKLSMVQIIRDPRDNYAAIKAGVKNYYKKNGENEMESLASLLNRARFDLELAKREIENKSNNFFVTRFEDLTKNPNTELKKITNFLKINFHENLLKPTFLGGKYSGNNHDGKKFNQISSINVNRNKERIHKQEIQIIEAWLKDIMIYWGYNCKSNHVKNVSALNNFYSWYNFKYFFKDSFKNDKK